MLPVMFNLLFLFSSKFRQEYLDTLYRYAKFQYECGNYSGAAEYLYFFRVLVSFQHLSLLLTLSLLDLSTLYPLSCSEISNPFSPTCLNFVEVKCKLFHLQLKNYTKCVEQTIKLQLYKKYILNKIIISMLKKDVCSFKGSTFYNNQRLLFPQSNKAASYSVGH